MSLDLVGTERARGHGSRPAVAGQLVPLPMVGLPDAGAIVGDAPPFSCNGPSSGSPASAPETHPLPSLNARLTPLSVKRVPLQSLFAKMLFATCTPLLPAKSAPP